MELPIKVFAVWDTYSKEWDYHISTHDMTTVGWCFVCEVMVPFEPLGHTELLKQATALLTKHKQKLLADSQVEANKVQAQIDEMLAIEYKPEPA